MTPKQREYVKRVGGKKLWVCGYSRRRPADFEYRGAHGESKGASADRYGDAVLPTYRVRDTHTPEECSDSLKDFL